MRNSFFDFYLKFGVKFCATEDPIDFLEIFFLRRNQKSMRNRHRPIVFKVSALSFLAFQFCSSRLRVVMAGFCRQLLKVLRSV